MEENSTPDYDIAVIGGGILGVSISFWLSEIYDCRIALIEKEEGVARHTSSRNTGMIHRPFYLNPEKKKLFAKASQKSYYLWKDLANRFSLTWAQIGTLEVALNDSQVGTLNQYKRWALQNGMEDNEIEILDSSQVTKLEPEVRCAGAIHSKTDTCVNYSEYTNFLFNTALKNGIRFIQGCTVERMNVIGDVSEIFLRRREDSKVMRISADFLINAAGGGAIEIAHKSGIAKEYADLNFRGEYWRVDEPFASKVTRNIYSVARFKEYPFLDPHFVLRASGQREIGPNAVLVSGPWAYKGLSETRLQFLSKIFERPLFPKLKLFTSKTFLSLVYHEWRSSFSKKAMCARVKEFLPSLDVSYLSNRGISGIRSSVISKDGFVPEALLLEGERSLHVLNYNSPGATGAPAFSAYAISKIIDRGSFDRLKKRKQIGDSFWKFEEAADLS